MGAVPLDPSPPPRRWLLPSSAAAGITLVLVSLLLFSGRLKPADWLVPYSGTGVAECAAAGSRQLTQPAAGARCILYAHEAPKCLRMDGKQEPGPCRFNALGCLFEEAVRMRLDVPPLCRVQAMAEAVAAAAAAWRPPPARLQGGLPPPRLATTQRRQQREREEQQTQPPQAEAIEQKQQEQRAQQQERRPLGAPGSWGPPAPSAAPGWQPAAAAFRPDGCPSPVTGAAGLVGWAQATGIRRIVMVGDSTMRQLFQRAVSLARAQPVTVDVVSQRYAHYSLGWAAPSAEAEEGTAAAAAAAATAAAAAAAAAGAAGAAAEPSGVLQDALWLSQDTYPAELRSSWPAVAARMQVAHSRLAARSAAGAALPAGMRSRELVVDLVVGTYRAWQPSNVQRYVADVQPKREETAFVLHACYWESGDKYWPDYVSFLRNLTAHARHVVVLTCPVAPGWRDAQGVAQRNAGLRRLVAEQAASSGAGSLRLLDAAATVEGAPLEATKADDDVHYQCGVYTTNGGSVGGVENGLYDGPHSIRRFDLVRVDRAGTCEDAINYALWQQLLCELSR